VALGADLATDTATVYGATTPSGYPNQFPFVLVLDSGTTQEEVCLATSGLGTSGSPWTVTRGYDGSTAKTHLASGGVISHNVVASDLAMSRSHEDAGQTSSPHGLPASAWAVSALAAIQETQLANSTTSLVTWTGIPQTYKHLLILYNAHCTYTGGQVVNLVGTVNNDTGSYYSWCQVGTDNFAGSLITPDAHQAFSQSNWGRMGDVFASQSGVAANTSGGIIWIPNYAGTTFNKMFVSHNAAGVGTGSLVSLKSRCGFYSPPSQSGITQLSLGLSSTGFFTTGSFFGLYGVA
jgi:hypothetical protein